MILELIAVSTNLHEAVKNSKGRLDSNQISEHLENIAEIKANGINYTNKMNLPPGQYGVWFVLRDNPSGRTGSLVVPLKVD